MLSRREREVMEILFEQGEGTLSDVANRMADPPTRPAMRSILIILIEKGHVMVGGKRGREYVYRPLRQPAREGAAAWRRVLETFFGGSVKRGLAAYLADPAATVSAEELKEIESLIRAARRRTTQR
jgi:BlaI family transcriptional regulator, penicillinase repressor